MSPSDEKMESCLICSNDFLKSCQTSWKYLSCCKNNICAGCYEKSNKTGTTMSGTAESFFKCPFCKTTSGIQVGCCPNGIMSVRFVPGSGPEDSWIEITYKINQLPHSLNRTAYLPYTEEGMKVLNKLQVAWYRRLTFTIGTSVTTGRTNTLVWNDIHHKTAKSGGPSNYGFPDPTYFLRVQEVLKDFGIE